MTASATTDGAETPSGTTEVPAIESAPPQIHEASAKASDDLVDKSTSKDKYENPQRDAPSAPSFQPQTVNHTRAPPSPAPRRPKPPTKGILKPPPPPGKPTLSNRLRDIAGVAKSLFDPLEDPQASSTTQNGHAEGSAPQTPKQGYPGVNGDQSGPGPSVSSALTAFSGRLGAGFNRLVVAASQSSPGQSIQGGGVSGSPMSLRSISLPEVMGSPLGLGSSEKARQKQPLKRATFMLPSLSITYPISSQGEPWSLKVVEDRDRIESSYRSHLSTSTGAEYWTNEKLIMLYENACRGREERPRGGIIRALELLPPPPRSRHIHIVLRPPERPAPPSQPAPLFVETPLNRHAAEALADILNIEWALTDLRLENGAVEADDALKPILHALLISGTLPSLSLAGNKRIKAGGWRLLAVFMKRARSLKYIDLSDTVWDRKGVEYLVQALNWTTVTPPSATALPSAEAETVANEDSALKEEVKQEVNGEVEAERKASYGSFGRQVPYLKDAEGSDAPSAVQTLRMDGCNLRAFVLEAFAAGIRTSDIKNLSLRRNRIGPMGGVSLALMIRDYPDATVPNTFSPTNMNLSSPGPGPNGSLDLPNDNTPHPYTPRSRRQTTPTPDLDADDASLPPIPKVTSSGGITSRTIPEGYTAPKTGSSLGLEGGVNVTPIEGRMVGSGSASMALQRSVRALDGVERIGRLLTLDLKNNEIKNGVTYIAQVLKRNRTLKVLNLGDNRIEPSGLTALAEALKYNSCLETLDLSSNPCSGPSLEGVTALRTTFTVNTSLKRLFLADTGLTTDGAIALAEFLPETKSLLHLDLTANPSIDTAGILALSVGLKSNTLIRCLDLSIPPNSPELAEQSQSILQSCIRNTELAADTAKPGPSQDAVWQPIKKSVLVKDVKAADRARQDKEREEIAKSSEGQAREFVYTLKPDRLVPQAEEVVGILERWFDAGKAYKSFGFSDWGPGQLPRVDYEAAYERAKILRERIVDRIQEDPEVEELDKLLGINDILASVLDKGGKFEPPPRLLLPSQIVNTSNTNSNSNSNETRELNVQTQLQQQQASPMNMSAYPRGNPVPRSVRRHMRVPSLEISSPNFSIGDSDNDSDAEEVDVGSFEQSPPRVGLPGVDISSQGRERLRVEDNTELGTSPVERVSRAWVEEEGEIFRKGTKLGVGVGEDEEEEEGEGDVSGEQLKQEILDIHIERSPTRRVVDDEAQSSTLEKRDENEN